jgi:hypothetical protein
MALRQQSSEQIGKSRFILFDHWKKLNTKVARQNLPENELSWLENLQPIGENVMQAVPGPNTALATVSGKTASRIFYANINNTDYAIFCASDGSITAVNAITGAQTVIATAGTFSSAPDTTVWSADRLLIMDLTGGYATWDGTLFVKSGGISPNVNIANGGSLFSSAPTLTITGGNGTGATLTAQVNPISVGSVNVTAPGSGFTSAPSVAFAGGGGGSGATATAVIGLLPGNSAGGAAQTGVVSVTVTAGGSGYTSAPTVSFSGGGGTLAAATAVLAGGSIVGVTLTAPGSGYLATDQPTVNVSNGGAGAGIVVGATVVNGGSGYTSAPTVAFSGGGSGSGAAATAVISGGVVTGLTITAGGTGYSPAPTIGFSGGGGTGAAATAQLGAIIDIRVWPQVFGNSIAIFAGRVWWSNGRILNFTGTGASTGGVGYDDLLPADAAGSTTISDADLAHSITGLRSLNNFLYIFGDQAIKQIGSITINNSITLFTILTLSSDVGSTFLMTVQSYNRLVLFANKNGVYGIFGATVQKLSDDLDGIFQLVDFTLPPSAALNDFHVNLPNTGGGSIHCYGLLVKYNDPIQGARNITLWYQTNKWFVVSQGGNLVAMAGIPLLSTTQWEVYASAGSDVTQLLQNGGVGVNIKLQTALTAHGNMVMAKESIRSGVGVTTLTAQMLAVTVDTENMSNSYNLSASAVVNWVNNASAIVQWINNSTFDVTFLAGGFRFPFAATEGYGRFMGATITAPGVTNLAINAVAQEYVDADLWGQIP